MLLNSYQTNLDENISICEFNTPTIETERLILRKFTLDDIEALFRIYSDKEVNIFLPWFPLESTSEAKALFESKYASSYLQTVSINYAICLKSDNIPIGYIEVDTKIPYDLGYGLIKELWHQGIVTEAAKVLVKKIKETNIPYITATHDIFNPRSGGVMRNIGMHYCYTYEELWYPKRKLVTFRMYQLNLSQKDAKVYLGYWNRYKVHYITLGVT